MCVSMVLRYKKPGSMWAQVILSNCLYKIAGLYNVYLGRVFSTETTVYYQFFHWSSFNRRPWSYMPMLLKESSTTNSHSADLNLTALGTMPSFQGQHTQGNYLNGKIWGPNGCKCKLSVWEALVERNTIEPVVAFGLAKTFFSCFGLPIIQRFWLNWHFLIFVCYWTSTV